MLPGKKTRIWLGVVLHRLRLKSLRGTVGLCVQRKGEQVSSITKRHVPTSQLLGEYLTFVPTPQQVDHFKG